METHVIEVGGTFVGHILGGAVLVVWALFWIGDARFVPQPAGASPLERTAIAPLSKVVFAPVAIWFEIPGSGWYPADVVMGWQHITIYALFGLTGVVDLLVRRASLAPWAGNVAFAAAMLNAGFLFLGHGGHGGVPGVSHTLLALLFLATGVVPLVELSCPGHGLEWVRRGSLLALGSWLVAISWILFRSDWDLADPVREGWTYLLFSWNAVAVVGLVAGAWLLARHRLRREESS